MMISVLKSREHVKLQQAKPNVNAEHYGIKTEMFPISVWGAL